ncbi:MAG: erythromycin esterase family protein, partial [Chitinophagaceae bacterium]
MLLLLLSGSGMLQAQPGYALDSNSWKPLVPLFTSRQVVGLGEATHGTKEFYEQRVALTKFLISQCGFRTIIWETTFWSMLAVNDYVAGGPGDPDSLLRNVGYWMYYTKEIRDLLQWIRAYNTTQQDAEKVQLHGMDIHFAPPPGHDAGNWQELAEQNRLYTRQLPKKNNEFRDSCMAANVIYILSATQSKGIVWAHNMHIARTDTIAGYDRNRMGEWLGRKYGKQYYPIGFFLQSGRFLAIEQRFKDGIPYYPNF